MIQYFDIFDKFEKPTLVLCNPNKTQLYALGGVKDVKLELRYNAVSKLSFKAWRKVDDITNEYFTFLVYRRLVYIANVGYFMISEVEESNDGIEDYKIVTAYSLECTLGTQKVSQFEGTYAFYDASSAGSSLMTTLLTYMPGWTFDSANSDASLFFKYRTFDVSDTTIYNLLMNEVEKAYECIFTFDTITKKITAKGLTTATTATDIYISYQNLVKNIKIKELTTELVTALNVYGAGDLDISTVNPLGTNTIYDFSYFTNNYTAWMSFALYDSIIAWKNKITANQASYANLLTSLKNLKIDLLDYTDGNEDRAIIGLVPLQSELTALEAVRKARIEGGIDIDEPYTDPSGVYWNSLLDAISSKESQIDAVQNTIDGINNQITSVTADLTVINTNLSFATNFTSAQLIDLQNYIVGSTYQNENFVITDIMTPEDIQNESQTLYNQAVGVLTRIAQPRYEFSLDAANFVLLKEFSQFTNQLVMGAIINLELTDGVMAYPVLLGVDINYEKPDDFSLIFSNRLRLDGDEFIYSDLFGQVIDSGINVNFNSSDWTSWTNYTQNQVSTFITSALDASKNELMSSVNQEIVINSNGLQGKKYISAGVYDPKQVWLTSNTLAFTKDAWNTASLALGQISFGNSTYYGLVADAVVGRLLAGNSLLMTNDDGSGKTSTFTFSGSGARLINSDFTMTTTAGKSRIYMNPAVGFKIQAYLGGTWKDRIALDTDGDITFSGRLSGPSGNLGGFTIDTVGIYKDSSHYIYSNGTIKWGRLSIVGDTAIFNGKIYASNLDPSQLITSGQIDTIKANQIEVGTLSGMYIYGSTIAWDGASLHSGGTGVPVIDADLAINMITGGDSKLYIGLSDIVLYANLVVGTGKTINFSGANSMSMGYTPISFYKSGVGASEIGMGVAYSSVASSNGFNVDCTSAPLILSSNYMISLETSNTSYILMTTNSVDHNFNYNNFYGNVHFYCGDTSAPRQGKIYVHSSIGSELEGSTYSVSVRLADGSSKLFQFQNGIFIGAI